MPLDVETLKAARYWAQQRPGMTARDRLARARADMAAGTLRYPGPVKPYPAVSWDSERPGVAYVSAPDASGLRLVGRVAPEFRGYDSPWEKSDRNGDNHGGWFTDPYGDSFRDGYGLAWGVVYRLSGRNGETRFVPGYQIGGHDTGPTLDLAQVYSESAYDGDGDGDAARKAARAADAMAQEAAESEREYQSASTCGARFYELGETIAAARRDALALLAERRAALLAGSATGFKAICATITAAVTDHCAAIKKAREERAALADGGDCDPLYWNPRDPALVAAFNESAGISARLSALA